MDLHEWEVTVCERTSKKWLNRKRWRIATRPDGETIVDGIQFRDAAQHAVDTHNAMVRVFNNV